MTEPDTYPDWSRPEWERQAREWISDHLARTGQEITGPVEPRARPWSLVWAVPTNRGRVWFKANNSGTRYESVLVGALARLDPAALPEPLAVAPERGWLLLADAGPTLRESIEAAGSEPGPALARWAAALTRYADLQQRTAGLVGELAALGVPDHRPELLPGLLADLLNDEDALLVGTPEGLDPGTGRRLREYRPRFAELCARLAGSGLPVTVQHDDLHDGNVLVGGGGYRFFDWGEANVGHPFGTLLVTLRSVADTFGLPPGDRALARLRDAYLEPWTDRHDRAELVETVRLALTGAKVSRALSWRRALATTDPTRGEYLPAVPGWLGELFEPDSL